MLALRWALPALLSLIVAFPSAAQQLPGVPDVKHRKPQAQLRLDSLLAQLVDELGTRPEAAIAKRAPVSFGEMVAVNILLEGNAEGVARFVGAAGGRVANVAHDIIEAYVPVSFLVALSFEPGVQMVEPIIPPMPLVLSEGTAAHNSTTWNGAGFRGGGVKVGVIDLGFMGFSALMGTELPATVVARCYTAVGLYTSQIADCEAATAHGTAVAEAIIDVAPDVILYISQPQSSADLQSTTAWMAAQGVKVINHSVAWTWSGPGDGSSRFSTSPLATVDQAVAADIVWVNAAGNMARSTWTGAYADANSNGHLEFAPGTEVNGVCVNSGHTLVAQARWDDTWGSATRDLDLYLRDESLAVVAYSIRSQNGAGSDPTETLVYTSPAAACYYMNVHHSTGEAPGWIQLQAFTGQIIQHQVAAYSVGSPAESASPGLLAVGAAPWSDTTTIEAFSSRGPTIDGRTKPEIVGIDRGDSATYGPNGFAGTSQAAPHVAGLAALVRERFPQFPPSEVAGYLKFGALGRGSVPNNDWGYGVAWLPYDAPAGSGGDYDGDGRRELAVWRPGNGTWYILETATDYASFQNVQWGSAAMNDVPVPGDYDGDGRPDLAVWRPGDGTWYILKSSTNYATYQQVQWGSGALNDVPVPGDYDGDGRTDIAVWRPGDGVWYILKSSTSYSSYQQVRWGSGALSDIPVPGDYDGDGRTDPAVWRPADGTWYFLRSSTGYLHGSQVSWGSAALNDIPVPGDYDGDGRTDIAVWRPGNGTWYILRTSSNYSAFQAVQWGSGALSDIPVPGDYDGDGRTDLAVWRPGSGTWYILKSSTYYSYASYQQVQWGAGAMNDVPLFER
jgi:hypothetical protein